jgi:glutaredoxin
MNPMKQQCYLANVWVTWLGLPFLAIAMGIYVGWWAGVFVLICGVFAQIAYIRIFPSISRLLGYGSVEDERAGVRAEGKRPSEVTLYTANVCPFCPIVKQRLSELQKQMNFTMKEVDITFRPEIIKSKGLRSVPVIEAEGRYWVGNATSAQLVTFLNGDL